MSYKLFLDDERFPITQETWVICRSFEGFKATILKNGCPNYISFDHDLGDGPTGKDCASWLIEALLDNVLTLPSDFAFYVHSQNPIGAMNIQSLLHNYLKFTNND